MIIKKIGLYQLLKVHDEFIMIDYIGKGNRITLQVFEDIQDAMKVFNRIIQETDGESKIHYDTFIRRIEDFETVQ